MGKNNSVKKIDEEQILKRFEYTVQEYIRFYDFYKNQEVSEENTEAFYVMLQTKLMILRKYDYNREDVYLSNVFDAIDKMYPEMGENINILREKFEKLNNYYMEVILSDGTSLNLYKAIEDVMYGLYLHADPDKIERLLKTNKNVYLMAVKEYIIVLEKIVIDTYNSIVDKMKNKYSQQEEDYSVKTLEKLVFPWVRSDWGDFSDLHNFVMEKKNIGLSSRVQYNDRHDIAYLKIFQNVENAFVVEQPHQIPDIWILNFVKKNEKYGWRIYGIGDKIADYKESGSILDWFEHIKEDK